MGRLLRFSEYVVLKESARRPSSKSSLYPLGYGGLGLYPAATWLPSAADAVLYITTDERLFDNGDSGPWPLSKLPGHKQYGDKVNNGTGEPWDIHHIPGPEPHKNFNTAGEGPPFDIRHIPNK